MNDKLLDTVRELTAMTDELLTLAKARRWEQLANLEKQRSDLIRKTIHPGLDQESLLAVRDDLRLIMLLDQQVIQLAEKSKDEVATDLIALKKNMKANDEYVSQQRR